MSREAALKRAEAILASNKSRVLIGVFGKPGVGKSTFTEYLLHALPKESACVLSMDGFHLSNHVLDVLGRRDRKGAPDTFDVRGFANLLKQIRDAPEKEIYFPIFDRRIEESIAAQGRITAEIKLVIVEGNYLCHDKDGWEGVADFFDETWYLDIDDEVRLRRLIARHEQFGKSSDDAQEWAHGTDERNAVLVGESAHKADFVVRLD